MPKISALPPITGNPASGDAFPFLRAASAETEKIDFNTLQSAVANAGTVQSLISNSIGGPHITLTATTSVVTPLLNTVGDTALDVSINGIQRWRFEPSGVNFDILPFGDNTQSFGNPGERIKTVFTPIIDSGTAGPLSLNTNNGSPQLVIANDGTITPTAGYRSSDASLGMTSNIIIGAKVMVIKNGIITSFA